MLEATLRKHPKTLSPYASLCRLASEAQSKQHEIRGIALREKETYILPPLDSFSDRLDRAQRGRCSKCGLNPCRVKGSWPTCCTTTHPRENVQSGGSARQLRHSNRNEDHEKDQQKNAVFTRRTVLHTRMKKQNDASNI